MTLKRTTGTPHVTYVRNCAGLLSFWWRLTSADNKQQGMVHTVTCCRHELTPKLSGVILTRKSGTLYIYITVDRATYCRRIPYYTGLVLTVFRRVLSCMYRFYGCFVVLITQVRLYGKVCCVYAMYIYIHVRYTLHGEVPVLYNNVQSCIPVRLLLSV